MRELGLLLIIILSVSCRKYQEYNHKPELEPLQQGIKASAAVGYCASIAASAYEGRELPSNVRFDKSSGLIYVKIDATHPLPFNPSVGDIIIAGIWRNNGGVISILLANIDILNLKTKLCGFYTIPVEYNEDQSLMAIFAKEDIVVGAGSDTILDLSHLTDSKFNAESDRANSTKPLDVFAAIKQNVWFINIDRANTYNNVYDDNITVTGGGQIIEVQSNSGGVLYHAMIDAKLNYSVCNHNPISGTALSQNFKAGGEPYVDLGNSILSFHNTCDGMAHVDFSSGKYLTYNNKYISLDLK